MKTKYGLSEAIWQQAKSEMQDILIQVAQQRQTITYGELANLLSTVTLHPYAYAFGALLREVCDDEENAERGLICALVVQKSSGIPGNGYFRHAQSCGRDISDIQICWQNEIVKLYSVWETDTME